MLYHESVPGPLPHPQAKPGGRLPEYRLPSRGITRAVKRNTPTKQHSPATAPHGGHIRKTKELLCPPCIRRCSQLIPKALQTKSCRPLRSTSPARTESSFSRLRTTSAQTYHAPPPTGACSAARSSRLPNPHPPAPSARGALSSPQGCITKSYVKLSTAASRPAGLHNLSYTTALKSARCRLPRTQR